MATYTATPEQIKEICEKVSGALSKFTTAQNCTYPTGEIVKGVEEGKDPEEIGKACYDAVISGFHHQHGIMTPSIHNEALFMSVIAKDQLEKYLETDDDETPEEPEEPETPEEPTEEGGN